jgi:hypothetical protein
VLPLQVMDEALRIKARSPSELTHCGYSIRENEQKADGSTMAEDGVFHDRRTFTWGITAFASWLSTQQYRAQ